MVILILFFVISGADIIRAQSAPNAGRVQAPIGDIETEEKKRIDEAIAFLNGTVKKQFQDLQVASKDEAVKALYLPFLQPSLVDLTASRHGAFSFRKRKRGMDQRPRAVSYHALKTAGALEDPNVWLAIAVDRRNDRPTGRYTPVRSDADVERYRKMYNAFVLLADFWVQDRTLSP